MFRRCLVWLEELLAGDGSVAREDRGVQRTALLRVCFDGRGEAGGEPTQWSFDLVVVPAVWHLRGPMLGALVSLLSRSAQAHAVSVELRVLHDRTDGRMGRESALLRARGARRVRVVVEAS